MSWENEQVNNGRINCCLLGCQGKYNDVTDCRRGFYLTSLTYLDPLKSSALTFAAWLYFC